ncbi:MAG: Sua5/YciO/YrdC/YwlC family protein [Planctomycetota bacterium]
MSAGTVIWSEMSEVERERSVLDVVASLERGGLVVIPTETVYGVAVAARSAEGVARLRDLRSQTGPLTWHAASVDAVRSLVDLPTAVHRRLVARLTPGPVRFEIEQTDTGLAALRERLGIEPGVIDDGTYVHVRMPSHPAGVAALAAAGGPVVAERLGVLGGLAEDRAPSIDAAEQAGLSSAIDGGPVAGRASTTIRLRLNGAFEVTPGGAIDEATVLGALQRTIAFVCTGNTCRSPMAEAIARGILAARPEDGITTRVVSAGVAAGPGSRATPEAVDAVAAMGFDLSNHRSRSASVSALAAAEHIYTMTEGHRRALLELNPAFADRVEVLDRERDIPDPIGGPAALYEQTARRLEELIRQRLAEIEP